MKLISILLLFLIIANAQNDRIRATKLNKPIEIDGIEEDIWKSAELHNNFTQTTPYPDKPASQQTAFRFLYDEENVYFFIHIYDDPDLVITQGGKRDILFRELDYIAVNIDPLFDHFTGYRFMVNPSNVQRDERLFDDDDEDDKWDAIWYSGTQRTENGWTAELQIPLRDLKFQETDNQRWGFNIERNIRRLREMSYWKRVDPDLGFVVSDFAIITDLIGLKSKNEINVIPSAVAIFDSDDNYDPSRSNRIIGLDLRYNFDERHSILATFKPDFSQIEADEDQLNISDYPLELDEKRPFFLEGNELYETPTDIYYSRRMTRPEYGAKFFGSAGFLKYGMTLVNNDGLYEDNGGSLLRNNEYFLIPRIKYVKSSSFSLGYLGGFVDSQYGQSGQLHSTDLLWRATNYIDVIGIFAKTSINGKSDFNEQYGFNVEYDTDAWEAEIGMQKISNNFALGLIGFPDPNNYAQLRGRLQRLFRFENSTFQELRFEAVLSNKGTYDFSAPTTNYSASIRVRQHLDYFGGISYGFGVNGVNGYFRNYDISAPSALYDNYGQFEAVDENGSAFNFFFDSDFSKAFGYFIRFEQQRYKQTDIINIQNNIQIKPIDDILIRFEINLRDIGPSQYLEEGTIWRINYKMNYSLLPNVFIRIFSQFNSQRDRLSNNLIINYEYVRGSFIYFAYNEVGTLDDSFNQGSFINNYNLDRRTFSLKWTYSFYL